LALKDNKGKEYYNNDRLKFEGEYFDERRWNGILYNYYLNEKYEIKFGSGKIKEYGYNGELIYEGKYLNGRKSGKAIEYNHYGNIPFRGKYKNGKRIEYHSNGKFKFEVNF